MSFTQPLPTVNLNTGKDVNIEYQNGPRNRLVVVSITIIITVAGGTGSALLAAKSTSPVGAQFKQGVSVQGGVLNETKVFTLVGYVPPLYYYKVSALATNATVSVAYSWDEVDL